MRYLHLAAIGLLIGCRATLPAAPAHELVKPDLAKLPKTSVCWIETAEVLGFTASALLVRHPKGDVLIDAGASSHFDEDVAAHPFFTRFRLTAVQGPLRPSTLLPDALALAGEPKERVTKFIVSHAHGDHLGGTRDLPDVPIYVAKEEADFIKSWKDQHTFHMIPAIAAAVSKRLRPLEFSPSPYETFDESADLFGDGSIVAVKLFGHTPGSIGVFVNVSPTFRIFYVGDATHDMQGIEERQEKGLMTRSTDMDKDAADRTVERLSQLWKADRSLEFLPAHDRQQWFKIFAEGPSHCR